jgi:hypothetical protein
MSDFKYKISNPNYIYIDDFNNVILESTFTIVLGKIDSSYRFVPQNNLVIEQGLTVQMLVAIAELIKKKLGIGEKKAEAIKEEPEEELKK